MRKFITCLGIAATVALSFGFRGCGGMNYDTIQSGGQQMGAPNGNAAPATTGAGQNNAPAPRQCVPPGCT